mmetsp:Transcript_21986/g.19540  ORF Transcript_21986/g.19540 Transcript_21986/m.19540 type:complete len:147 (+) Transcript_21986:607-1047(+)
MKNYYACDFKLLFNFTKRVRRINIDHSANVYKNAESYINSKFGENSGDLYLIFVALIDSKQKYTLPSEKYPELNIEINSLLRSFNKEKAKNLIYDNHFATLLLHYLKTKGMDEIRKTHTHQQLRQAYLSKGEELKKICMKVLGKED